MDYVHRIFTFFCFNRGQISAKSLWAISQILLTVSAQMRRASSASICTQRRFIFWFWLWKMKISNSLFLFDFLFNHPWYPLCDDCQFDVSTEKRHFLGLFTTTIYHVQSCTIFQVLALILNKFGFEYRRSIFTICLERSPGSLLSLTKCIQFEAKQVRLRFI